MLKAAIAWRMAPQRQGEPLDLSLGPKQCPTAFGDVWAHHTWLTQRVTYIAYIMQFIVEAFLDFKVLNLDFESNLGGLAWRSAVHFLLRDEALGEPDRALPPPDKH